MHCAACASTVQKGLAELPGVTEARVNFGTARATVFHEPGLGEAEIVARVESLGYSVPLGAERDELEAERQADLGRRFVVALVLSVPTVLISMLEPIQFGGWEWVVAALATPVVFWSGWGFHAGALGSIRRRTATMDTLVSLGTSAAWAWSTVVLVGDIAGEHVYYETAAVIVSLILLGRWLEARARRRSGEAIRSLAELGSPTAVLADGRTVPASELEIGMRFLVRAGEKVATDGRIVEGTSAVDTSMVTGEPVPVDVGVGDELIGGTVNTYGSLVVEATRVGAETTLAQIIRLVDEAQGSRAHVQRLADRVAAVFVPVALAIALITLAAWLVSSADTADAFTAAVAVLIISCPCALGLATPLGIIVGTGRGAQLGVIIKGGEVLEDTRRIDTVVLDKTGTVTEGRMRLARVLPENHDPELLGLVAALESRSDHPIAHALSAGWSPDAVVTDVRDHPGAGLTGRVDGVDVTAGAAELFERLDDGIAALAEQQGSLGDTTLLAGRNGVAQLVLVVEDRIKPGAVEAVEALQAMGIEVALLTGDNRATAERVGRSVGVSSVTAEVMPDQKATEVAKLRSSGRRVAMVGDGVNDAPALAEADLGIAIGAGSDVAIEASDLTIVAGDLRAAVDAISLSRRTLGTIKGNLFWAFAYNVTAIPLAAFGVLNPMIAAAAMGLSSLFVVTNSLRLRRFQGIRRLSDPEA